MKSSLKITIRNTKEHEQIEHWVFFSNNTERIVGPYLETLFIMNNNTTSIFLSFLGYFERISSEKRIQSYIKR